MLAATQRAMPVPSPLPGRPPDMSITKRYVHPQEFSTRLAMEKARVARGVEQSGHTPILKTETQVANLRLTS